MLEDIRIFITDKMVIDSLINHALNIGYYVDLSISKYLYDAEYLFLDPNQAMKWGDKGIYDAALNYKEFTAAEFLEYKGGYVD